MHRKDPRSPKTLLAAMLASFCTLILVACASNTLNSNSGKVAAPSVLTQPVSQTVQVGQAAGFSVSVVGYGTVTYQWYLNGVAVAGATDNTFILSAVEASMNGATVYVVATDAAGSVSSAIVTLTVSSTPVNTTNSPGSGTTTAVAALSCSSTAPGYGGTISLVPVFNAGTAVIGTRGAGSSDVAAKAVSGTTYTSAAVTSAQTYTLTVTGAGGSGDTSSTTATCRATPTNVSLSGIQPNGSTIAPAPVSFTANVTGGATNAVTWAASGGSFSGSTWTPPNTAGTYTVTATSADNSAIHASVNITISVPVITKQPTSVAACASASSAFAVTANYAASYQWYLGGSAIAGATAASYLVPSASSMDAGTYTVAVTNPAGSVTSQAAALTVGSAITANPVSTTVGLLQPATFSVAASGKSPFTYQWYAQPAKASAFAAVPGATASTYSVTAVSDSGGNQYYAIVKDACGTSLTSTPATLNLSSVPVPPTITSQPANQAVAVGSTATFQSTTTGTGTLTYQWYRVPAGTAAGQSIAGANAISYTVPAAFTNLDNDQDGYYQTVSNAAGAAVSTTATLAVNPGILVRAVDEPQTVIEGAGQSAVFSVVASSTAPLTYQWYQAAPGSSNFTAIPGATSSSYTIASTTVDQNGSSFYVVVSNGLTTPVTSTKAGLFVGQFPLATNLCDSWAALGYATAQASCGYQLTPAKPNLAGAVMWPTLVPTSNLQLTFNVATSNASNIPGEGFAVVLGDATQGATPKSLGSTGLGLGASGIPGFAIAFNTDSSNDGRNAPFLGNTFSQASQWGNPWLAVNTTLATLAAPGVTTTHTVTVNMLAGTISVALDGVQVFHGNALLPPVAYLYLTAANGSNYEQVTVSNLTATFSPQ